LKKRAKIEIIIEVFFTKKIGFPLDKRCLNMYICPVIDAGKYIFSSLSFNKLHRQLIGIG